MRVDLDARYDEHADWWFWLRGKADGSPADEVRACIAAVYARLDPFAFMLIDTALAGERGGPSALRPHLDEIPEEVMGVPARAALAEMLACLDGAPPAPPERRAIVEERRAQLDVAAIERAIAWGAEQLCFGAGVPNDAVVSIEVALVASGVPFGGLTGLARDDQPICFAAVEPHPGSTLAEVIVHESLHAVDGLYPDADSVLSRLRAEPGAGPQLWHVPMFVIAAEAVRRFVDVGHDDYGNTHGYYAKVPADLERARALGVLPSST